MFYLKLLIARTCWFMLVSCRNLTNFGGEYFVNTVTHNPRGVTLVKNCNCALQRITEHYHLFALSRGKIGSHLDL